MKIETQKAVVTLAPETAEETAQLEKLWKLLIDCNGPTLKLCPIGEYVPAAGEKSAMFYIEGQERSRDPERVAFVASPLYTPEVAPSDCTVYCPTCNKSIQLKKGDPIPLCCGKPMINIDD
ncbi:MAG: hypothetical protein LBS90_03810 [Oscillospiraceae bacterium]|jgi:hypothetical protein|nr:hypothetical protein [Oscillospiraceae bacterium]